MKTATNGASAWRPETGIWHAGADGDPAGPQPALVARQRTRMHWPAAGGAACMGVIDDYIRGCLACIVDTSLSGRRIVRELAAIAERRGLPCMVVNLIETMSQAGRWSIGHRRSTATFCW